MDRQTQDLAWACTPKKMRGKIISTYYCKAKSSNEYNIGYSEALEQLYGKHNLTSDTEPEEMLMVERKKVQEYKSDIEYTLAGSFSSEYSKGYWRGQQTALDRLFCDLCLPDKDESGQREPKFKVGDKVKVKPDSHSEKIVTVESVYTSMYGGFSYSFKDCSMDCHESSIEPYTEPETKDMEEKSYPPYLDRPKHIVPTMEEKELNLCELLKGYVGEIFYSPALGDVEILNLNDNIEIMATGEDYSIDVDNAGRWDLCFKNHTCILYPSRALYEKYPLDAKKAWDEWASERKPKRWRAKKGEKYWWINDEFEIHSNADIQDSIDNTRYDFGNYFRTEELARQAAEVIREFLKTFHENISK